MGLTLFIYHLLQVKDCCVADVLVQLSFHLLSLNFKSLRWLFFVLHVFILRLWFINGRCLLPWQTNRKRHNRLIIPI